MRLNPEQKWDSLPAALVEDCAQLTKANSIEGALRTCEHPSLPLYTHGSMHWGYRIGLREDRQQERQRNNNLHALVEPPQKLLHGHWPSFFPRPEKGNNYSPRLPPSHFTQLPFPPPPPPPPLLHNSSQPPYTAPLTNSPFSDQKNPRHHTHKQHHKPPRENPHRLLSRRAPRSKRSIPSQSARREETGG